MTSLDVAILVAAAAAAALLAILAAIISADAAEDRDMRRRVDIVLRGRAGDAPPPKRRSLGAVLLAPLRLIGSGVKASALFSPKDIIEYERTLASSGFDPRVAMPVLAGIKVLMLPVGPLLGYAAARGLAMTEVNTGIAVIVGLMVGMLGPNYALRMLGSRVHRQLRLGLPDALDLMVVCAEAGIALESALERVARDMERNNRPVALELALLIHELRVIGDRREAFQRMANRTEIEGFKRLASTLAQAVRYGTPLSQALRTLAVEMRADRMVAIEEKAVRLPALLVMPLILFILPALFIALAGPSLVGMGDVLGSLGR